MSERTKAILHHILESFVVSILAGGIVALLVGFNLKIVSAIIEAISLLGFWGIAGFGIVLALCIGIIFHRWCISMVKSLKYFPYHFGFISKIFVGIIVYCLCILCLHRIDGRQNNIFVFVIGLLILFIALGITIIAGIFCEWLLERKNLRSGDDDRPIERLEENKIPSHRNVAHRMLTKLLSGPRENGLQPSIALSGPYGSGKTSICNLVKCIYDEKKHKGKSPRIIFCRFEAWQFLSAEAAVKGLLDIAVGRILEEVDSPELWSVPERYVQAIKEGSGSWGWVWAFLFGEEKTPDILKKSLEDILLRLNLRLVIFIDDFDRIETDEGNCQQAMAKALNQLQNIPNVQYIICVGPVLSTGNMQSDILPSKDLLKLTRYQELVPEIAREDVIRMVKEMRDKNLEDTTCYFPWAEITEDRGDPLHYSFFHIEFYPLYTEMDLTDKLIGLIRTPRALKTISRESDKAWNGGLRGEINWYDFLLLNAIKAVEPGVFEWILRNSNLFIGVSSDGNIGTQDKSQQEAHNKIAQELQTHLRSCLQSKDEEQYQLIHHTLCYLFPAFKERILPLDLVTHLLRVEPWVWSQKVSLRFIKGSDYLSRFCAGGVYEPDVPDQPVLQHIKKIKEEGFNVAEFQERYLASEDKLTGIFNKFVLFSGLLPFKNGYEICETLLEWISDPEHAKIWQEPYRYIHDMMPDVIGILKDSRRNQIRVESDEWFKKMLNHLIEKSPLTAIVFEESVQMAGFSEGNGLGEVLIQKLYAEFVEGERKFIPAFGEFRYSLNDFIRAVRKKTDFDKFKTRLTEKLIEEANGDDTNVLKARIVLCLVEVTIPMKGRPVSIEEYGFKVNIVENKSKLDMEVVVPALQRWKGVPLSDPVAAKAMEYLLKCYTQ